MPVTTTSNIAKTATALKTMVSEIAAFRTWVGAADAAAALAFIDIAETGSSMGTVPRCRIGRGGEHQQTSLAAGAGATSSGALMLTFYDAHVAATPWIDHENDMLNNAGAVIEGLMGADEGLYLRSIDGADDPIVTQPDKTESDDGQTVRARFRVAFGLEGVSSE